MRRGNDNGIVFNEDGSLAGVSLGADFTAEHEIGIKGIRRRFGMNDDAVGIQKRTITKPSIKWYEKEIDEKVKIAGFTSYFDGWDGEDCSVDQAFRVGEIREPHTTSYGKTKATLYGKLQTAWDENHFCAFSAAPEEQEHLQTIFQAIQHLDAVIMLAGGGVWQNSGLTIGILSAIPEHLKEKLRTSDLENIRMKKEFEATGIEARLTAAGKRWFALSPRFKEDGSLVAWLNPMEQQKNNFGWFTVADFDAWIAGTGPIPIQREI